MRPYPREFLERAEPWLVLASATAAYAAYSYATRDFNSAAASSLIALGSLGGYGLNSENKTLGRFANFLM